jgi:hypothetical protein
MPRSFAGCTSETHRHCATSSQSPGQDGPARLCIDSRPRLLRGVHHSSQGGARDAAAGLIYLVSSREEWKPPAQRQTRTRRWGNSPARRATTDDEGDSCLRSGGGLAGFTPPCAARHGLGSWEGHGTFLCVARVGRAEAQAKARYLGTHHRVARRLAGRSGLAGAVFGRPGERAGQRRVCGTYIHTSEKSHNGNGPVWPAVLDRGLCVCRKGKRKSTGHTIRVGRSARALLV